MRRKPRSVAGVDRELDQGTPSLRRLDELSSALFVLIVRQRRRAGLEVPEDLATTARRLGRGR